MTILCLRLPDSLTRSDAAAPSGTIGAVLIATKIANRYSALLLQIDFP